MDAHVILSVLKRNHRAEINLSANGTSLFSDDETKDLYSAIDLAMDKIERQIQKHITKREKRKHTTGTARAAAAPTPARGKKLANVVPVQVKVEPLSVAEAVRRLSKDSDEFLVFMNEASDAINVLYRRKDGGFGLIEPEVG
jgi:putative sigma-54 modulation protein